MQMSMHPLLERDGLNLPYTALILAWTAVAVLLAPRSLTGSSESGSRKGSSPNSSAEEAEGTGTATAETRRFKAGLLAQILALLEGLPRSPLFCTASLLLLVALHAAKVLVAPPAHLPWLWDRAFTTVGFLYLAVIAGHLQLAQWQLPDLEGSRRRRKQKLP
jgi:alpha-1,3-glucosyltransferase